MKFIFFVLALAITGASVGYFIEPNTGPNTPNCQEIVATKWFDIAPGETFCDEYEMSGCAPAGWYSLYAHISKKNSSPLVRPRDKLLFELTDTSTGLVYQSDQRVTLRLDNPDRVAISVTNEHKSQTRRIRVTFQNVVVVAP